MSQLRAKWQAVTLIHTSNGEANNINLHKRHLDSLQMKATACENNKSHSISSYMTGTSKG